MAKLGSTIHGNETILSWLVKIIFSKIGIVSRTEVISLLEELGEAASLEPSWSTLLQYCSRNACRNVTTQPGETKEMRNTAQHCHVLSFGLHMEQRGSLGLYLEQYEDSKWLVQ